MRHLRLPFALLALSALLLAILGCDSADNPIAPTGSVLTITANPTQISLNGSATLTVTGFKPDGNPLNPGTQINLSTTLGVLAQTLVEVANGRAITTLAGDGRSGTATVTATLPGGGETSATVDVLVGQTAETQPTLSITASPNVIGLGESAEVTALARNADGSLRGAGGQVSLRTDLGWLLEGAAGSCGSSGPSAVTVTTRANSEAQVTLCSGDQPGSATLTGSVDSSAEVTATVTFENQKPVLLISANPTIVSVATADTPDPETSTITVIARDSNSQPLGTGFRIRLTADLGELFDLGGARVTEVPTDENSEAVAIFRPGSRAGIGSVTAILGSSDPVSAQITIRDAPATVDLQLDTVVFSPQPPPGGTDFVATITVTNAEGEPSTGEIVRMAVKPLLSGDCETGNRGGEVAITLTPSGGPSTDGTGRATATVNIISDSIPPESTPLDILCFEAQVRQLVSNLVPVTIQR